MAAPATIDTSNLVCQDTFTTAKGAKTIPLASRDGAAVQWQPREPMAVLWALSLHHFILTLPYAMQEGQGPRAF